ncbi:IclR family transcriptional regulator [Roseomonas chloroacetimidivorans]|uniref:IclR family transcriptional regulator n=1 Tax=Roseomonas chloroacetimidivorans TaxID=1766656 RepID=UPI003C787754
MKTRRGVESVEVAGLILQALLAVGGTARVKDLEKRTGIPSAKVHRYLVSLVFCGLVRRREDGRYGFGLLAYQVGQLAQHGHDLMTMVAPEVAQFARDVGESCGVALWLDQGPTIVHWFHPERDVNLSLKPGLRVELTASTTGRVMGAHLPCPTVEQRLAAELAGAVEAKPYAYEQVEADFARIRQVGYARGQGLRVPGLNTFSVPVFERDQRLACVLTMIGHESTFSSRPDTPQALALLAFSRRLSRILGAQTGVSENAVA